MVLVPQGADQYINADACERIGLARVVRGETGTSTTVRDAVLAIIRPESLERAAAHRLAAEIEAMPTATQVAQDLRVEAN